MFEEAIRPVTEAIMADLGSQPMSAPAAKLLSQVMHWQEGEKLTADLGHGLMAQHTVSPECLHAHFATTNVQETLA